MRDVLQLFEVENILTTFLHRTHEWCGMYCDYVAFPFEIGAMFGAWVVLERNQVGLIGILTLCFPFLILVANFLP